MIGAGNRGEESHATEVHAENRHLTPLQAPRAAEQGAVTTEGHQQVDGIGIERCERRRRERLEFGVAGQRPTALGGQAGRVGQHFAEISVAGVADESDAQREPQRTAANVRAARAEAAMRLGDNP